VRDDELNWSETENCIVRIIEVTLSGGGDLPVGDLVEIDLSVNPDSFGGEMKLTALGAYKNSIKVWKEESKQTLYIGDGTYYKTWPPGALPATLWVEGISPTGTPTQAKLTLLYDPSSHPYLSPVEEIYFTVFNVEITSVTLPNNNVSFTTLDAENDISCQADIKPDLLDSTYNSQIEWEIEDDPSVTGDSGDPDDSETGNNVSLTVTAPSASSGRNFKLNYRIRASLTIDSRTFDSAWEAIIQDDKDQLRQLYVDTGYSPIPSRTSSAMVNSSTYQNPGNLSFNELDCNGDEHSNYCGGHTYQLDSTVSTVFQTIRNAYESAIPVSSVYRCPRWNIHEGGTTNSKHTQGNAFDYWNLGTTAHWDVAWTAYDECNISASKILLYPQSGGGSYKNLQYFITNGYNGTNLPPGWTAIQNGHITTN